MNYQPNRFQSEETLIDREAVLASLDRRFNPISLEARQVAFTPERRRVDAEFVSDWRKSLQAAKQQPIVRVRRGPRPSHSECRGCKGPISTQSDTGYCKRCAPKFTRKPRERKSSSKRCSECGVVICQAAKGMCVPCYKANRAASKPKERTCVGCTGPINYRNRTGWCRSCKPQPLAVKGRASPGRPAKPKRVCRNCPNVLDRKAKTGFCRKCRPGMPRELGGFAGPRVKA